MFNVGDKVVYPMHGAGTIVAIEEKVVLGQRRKYYVLQMPMGNMKVMVPMDKVEKIGLRSVISPEEAQEVLVLLRQEQDQMAQNWNRRYRNNMEKIKTGDIIEVGEVVRNLTLRERQKGLSTGEKKLLNSARQILVSELVLALDCTEEEVLKTLEEIFRQD